MYPNLARSAMGASRIFVPCVCDRCVCVCWGPVSGIPFLGPSCRVRLYKTSIMHYGCRDFNEYIYYVMNKPTLCADCSEIDTTASNTGKDAAPSEPTPSALSTQFPCVGHGRSFSGKRCSGSFGNGIDRRRVCNSGARHDGQHSTNRLTEIQHKGR